MIIKLKIIQENKMAFRSNYSKDERINTLIKIYTYLFELLHFIKISENRCKHKIENSSDA